MWYWRWFDPIFRTTSVRKAPPSPRNFSRSLNQEILDFGGLKNCGPAFVSEPCCSRISHQLFWNPLTVLSSALKSKWSQLRPLFWPWIHRDSWTNTRRYKRLSAAVVNFEAKKLTVVFILDISNSGLFIACHCHHLDIRISSHICVIKITWAVVSSVEQHPLKKSI